MLISGNSLVQIVVLVTVFICVECQLNCSKPQKEEKCVTRYDFLAEINKIVKSNYSNPCNANSVWYCNCINSTVKVLYFEMPPYIYLVKNGSANGIIPALLNLAYGVCCFGCTNIVYRKPVTSLIELMLLYNHTSHFDALFPVLASAQVKSSFGGPFVQLFPTAGVAYIQIDEESKLVMNKLITSLLSNWPLFVIALILTVHAGVIIWILDSWQNPDDFPPSVFSGMTEGSWWAYISMTTVGYGDKCPKSWIGRAFSVIWIAIGISICGIFTASLTSAMTSSVLSEKTKLEGKKVGVMDHGILKYETNIIHRDGGTPTEYKKISSLTKALKDDEIDGILMDKMVLRYHWNEINTIGLPLLVKEDVKNSNTVIGIQFKDKKLADFIGEFFDSNKDADKRMLNDAIKIMGNKVPNPDFPKPVTTSPFSSPVIYTRLLKYLGLSCLIVVGFGCLCELLKTIYRKRVLLKRKILTENCHHESGDQQDATEKTDKLENLRKRIEDSILKEIREEFQMLKFEMNSDQNNSHEMTTVKEPVSSF